MSEHIITAAEDLDALPEGSVVLGYDVDEHRPIVALKPLATDYPHAATGYWEAMNSELGTTSEDLVSNCVTLTVLHIGDPTHD